MNKLTTLYIGWDVINQEVTSFYLDKRTAITELHDEAMDNFEYVEVAHYSNNRTYILGYDKDNVEHAAYIIYPTEGYLPANSLIGAAA